MAQLADVLKCLHISQERVQGAVLTAEDIIEQQQEDIRRVKIKQEEQSMGQAYLQEQQSHTEMELWKHRPTLEFTHESEDREIYTPKRRQSAPELSAHNTNEDRNQPPNLPGRRNHYPSTVVYQQITPAPVFNLDRYEDWEKSTTWWKEMNRGKVPNRPLATVGVTSSPLVKSILQDYFDRTKMDKNSRTLEGFMEMMEERFRGPMGEIVMLRIQQWN